ncbi:MAG: hypothetical protein ACO3JL_05795 [Myxococcota bacterium]
MTERLAPPPVGSNQTRPPAAPQKSKATWRVTLLRWLAQRWGLGHANPYIEALTGLARDASVPFPRELIPMLATQNARALLAAQVFQSGPEWVWPYWVNRQLDPRDAAYLPRAMSPVWHNLTHRNWTAIGVPDGQAEGVVDPRGLLMPQRGGWSVDIALLVDGVLVAPARLLEGYEQRMAPDMPWLTGTFAVGDLRVVTECWAERIGAAQMARLRVTVQAGPEKLRDATLAISLRPYNPEGPAIVHRLEGNSDGFVVDGKPALVLAVKPNRISLSTFWEGDAFLSREEAARPSVYCEAGMASGAAFYPMTLEPRQQMSVECAGFIEEREATSTNVAQVRAALRSPGDEPGPSRDVRRIWRDRRESAAQVELCDRELQRLYEQCHTTLLVLDDVDSIKPGPFTYHQHWFRDSAYLVTALARLGHRVAARQKLLDYPERQDRDGFFRSQDGEWDSNGQAIWTMVEYIRLFDDKALLAESFPALERGARWISSKRLSGERPVGHEGLLPSGISAEHLGPHDYYLWDDFWGVAGLRSASLAASLLGKTAVAQDLSAEADAFLRDIDMALHLAAQRTGRPAMPAAPSRSFDCGMIGNVAAVYPLELLAPGDERVLDTLRVLEERFFVDDAFLQANVHSGYNIYLTLQCAQLYLRAGRLDDAWRLVRRTMALASSTGTWPEAVHPRTLGGCMGDGHHGWAAAELCLFVRAALVQEQGSTLCLTPGFPLAWREGVGVRQLPTYFGEVTFAVQPDEGGLRLLFDPRWRGAGPSSLHWCLPAEIRMATVDGLTQEVPQGARSLRLPLGVREARVWLMA